MLASPNSRPDVGAAPSRTPITRTPAEQQQHLQAKALKKERKNERLRNFFAWCAGCRFISGSF